MPARSENLRSLMTTRIGATVIAVQCIGRTRVGEGRSGNTRTLVLQQDRRIVPWPRNWGVASSDVADGRQDPTHHRSDDVDQALL